MEPRTSTTVYHLKIGDRFYKVNDKKKAVYEMVAGETKQTYFQTYKHFAAKDGEKFSQAIKSTTEVIFLRHKEEKAHEQKKENEQTIKIEGEKKIGIEDGSTIKPPTQ